MKHSKYSLLCRTFTNWVCPAPCFRLMGEGSGGVSCGPLLAHSTSQVLGNRRHLFWPAAPRRLPLLKHSLPVAPGLPCIFYGLPAYFHLPGQAYAIFISKVSVFFGFHPSHLLLGCFLGSCQSSRTFFLPLLGHPYYCVYTILLWFSRPSQLKENTW